VAVEAPEREGEAGAAGGQGPKAQRGEDPRRSRVPRVGDHEGATGVSPRRRSRRSLPCLLVDDTQDHLAVLSWRQAPREGVERLPDPDDRRGTRVRLTPRGKATIDPAISMSTYRTRTAYCALSRLPSGRPWTGRSEGSLAALEERSSSSGTIRRRARAGVRSMNTTIEVSPVGSSSPQGQTS
jgi:hypothetical protein